MMKIASKAIKNGFVFLPSFFLKEKAMRAKIKMIKMKIKIFAIFILYLKIILLF